MRTPYEELEYLSEFLPEEGEAVVVTRRSGELVCESLNAEPGGGEPLIQSDFYGRLVAGNERLKNLVWAPVWIGLSTAFAMCVLLHQLTGLKWSGWFWDVGIVFLAALAVYGWIRWSQKRAFAAEIRPMLNWQIEKTEIDRYRLIGAVRHQPELRSLFRQLARWVD